MRDAPFDGLKGEMGPWLCVSPFQGSLPRELLFLDCGGQLRLGHPAPPLDPLLFGKIIEFVARTLFERDIRIPGSLRALVRRSPFQPSVLVDRSSRNLFRLSVRYTRLKLALLHMVIHALVF